MPRPQADAACIPTWQLRSAHMSNHHVSAWINRSFIVKDRTDAATGHLKASGCLVGGPHLEHPGRRKLVGRVEGLCRGPGPCHAPPSSPKLHPHLPAHQRALKHAHGMWSLKLASHAYCAIAWNTCCTSKHATNLLRFQAGLDALFESCLTLP